MKWCNYLKKEACTICMFRIQIFQHCVLLHDATVCWQSNSYPTLILISKCESDLISLSHPWKGMRPTLLVHNRHQILQVIGIDTIIQCAHLIGVYGPDPVNTKLKYSNSLFTFHTYVNKYTNPMQITVVLK